MNAVAPYLLTGKPSSPDVNQLIDVTNATTKSAIYYQTLVVLHKVNEEDDMSLCL